MDRKVDVESYARSRNYKRFLNEPNNGVSVTGKFDVTNLYKLTKRGHKFNCLMLYCLQQAGQSIDEFHYAIKNGELYYCDDVTTDCIVKGKDNNLYSVTFCNKSNFVEFENNYKLITAQGINNCTDMWLDEGSCLTTSAVVNFPFVSFAVDSFQDFKEHFFTWGAYTKKFFKVYLNVSMRFNHALADGEHVCKLFNALQREISQLKIGG